MHLPLLYRDALILIINKPAGIPVHKGKGGGDNLENHFEQLRFGLPRLPSLAHRLDKETSGCLVLGRHRQALQTLQRLFANQQIKKEYLAIVHGTPREVEGIINIGIKKKDPRPTSWRMIAADDGEKAITHYKLLESANGKSLILFSPHTGRTHQLRVHAAHIGCPIVGDYLYGPDNDEATRPMLHLHASRVTIPLYPKRESITAEAPLSAHMLETLAQLGKRHGITGELCSIR